MGTLDRMTRREFWIGVVLWLALPTIGHAQLADQDTYLHGTMVDALGDTLHAHEYPHRIISLSPNLTETLFALGVTPHRIVGVTNYCDYPPMALAVLKVGGIVDPSIERIQSLRPDLVLATRGNPVETIERIRSLGLATFAVDDRTDLEGIRKMVSTVWAVVGPENANQADALIQRFWSELRAYRQWAEGIPEKGRPKVYFVDPVNPGFTAGPGSHIDDLIHYAGGWNVVREGGAWPTYSNEALLLAQPDWLLVAIADGTTTEGLREAMRKDPALSTLSALAAGRVCWVPAGELLRPGPRVLDALEKVAACLHPDAKRPMPPWKTGKLTTK